MRIQQLKAPSRVLSILITLIWLGGVASASTTVEVEVKDFEFNQKTVNIQAGDTVRWKWVSGSHSVTSGSSCSADNRFDFSLNSTATSSSFTFTEAGTYHYFCRPHCSFGMTGQVVVATATPPPQKLTDPIPAPIEPGAVRIHIKQVADGLTAPNWGTPAPGDRNQLFVTDQTGILWAIDLNTGRKAVFADLTKLLVPLGIQGPGSYDERGLLGVAFHPDYRTNGLLYTFTSEPPSGPADFSTIPPGTSADHQSVIREWRVPAPVQADSVVDPASTRILLSIDKPQFNHNGGALNFGKDGLLYISTGDGGAADDQGSGHSEGGNGQDKGNVLGKILRIDPNLRTSANGQYGIPGSNPFVSDKTGSTGGEAGCADSRCDEIYAYGFRNPFRFSFDRSRGDLWAADVGQNAIEEVDVVRRGGNYGWRFKEGSFCFDANGDGDGFVTDAASCGPRDLRSPVAEYDHDEGIATVGGFVYRGRTIPGLRGHYVFGDYVRTFGHNDGRLFYLERKNLVTKKAARKSGVVELLSADGQPPGISVMGFGQDSAGELYVLGNRTGIPDGTTGVVLKIVP